MNGPAPDPPLTPGAVVLLRAEVLRVFADPRGLGFVATLRVADCTTAGRYVPLVSDEALLLVQPEAPDPYTRHEAG